MHILHDGAFRDRLAEFFHGFLEPFAILSLFDGIKRRAEELYAMLLQYSFFGKLNGKVQPRLPAKGGKEAVGLFLRDNLRQKIDGERFDIDAIRDIRIRHNGRGIAVDEHDLKTVLLECAAGLGAGVVELCRLSDDDRPRADDHNLLQIFLARHRLHSLHQIPKRIKEVHIVVGTRRRLRMVLYGKYRERRMPQSLNRLVVDVDMGYLERRSGKRGGVDRIAVVLRGDMYLSRC